MNKSVLQFLHHLLRFAEFCIIWVTRWIDIDIYKNMYFQYRNTFIGLDFHRRVGFAPSEPVPLSASIYLNQNDHVPSYELYIYFIDP